MLNLTQNGIDDDGVQYLADGLASNTVRINFLYTPIFWHFI